MNAGRKKVPGWCGARCRRRRCRSLHTTELGRASSPFSPPAIPASQASSLQSQTLCGPWCSGSEETNVIDGNNVLRSQQQYQYEIQMFIFWHKHFIFWLTEMDFWCIVGDILLPHKGSCPGTVNNPLFISQPTLLKLCNTLCNLLSSSRRKTIPCSRVCPLHLLPNCTFKWLWCILVRKSHSPHSQCKHCSGLCCIYATVENKSLSTVTNRGGS